MQNISQFALCLLLTMLFVKVIQAQDYYKNDTLKLPVAPKTSTPFDSRIMTVPDQIGFGLLYPDDIDTDTASVKLKNMPQGLSLKQFVAIREKDFKKWESSVFAPNVNIYWGLSPDEAKQAPFLFGLPIPIVFRGYMAPGGAATKLSPSGLPPLYPIQQRVQNDMKRQIEKIEREAPKHNIYKYDDGLDEILDDVLCLFQNTTNFNVKSLFSLKFKLL